MPDRKEGTHLHLSQAFRSHSLWHLQETRPSDAVVSQEGIQTREREAENLPQGTLRLEGELWSNLYSWEQVCPPSPIQARALGTALPPREGLGWGGKAGGGGGAA